MVDICRFDDGTRKRFVMSVRTLIVVLLALVCGVSAAIGVHQIVTQRRTQVSAESVNIVVAASDLARGSVLSEEVLKLQPWPKDLVPTGAILDLSEVNERTVVTRVFPGDPILESKLAEGYVGTGLASMIPHGMRAFTIRTANVASGVAGFILPGHCVDVLMTTTGSSAGEGSGGGSDNNLTTKRRDPGGGPVAGCPRGKQGGSEHVKECHVVGHPRSGRQVRFGD